jgi:hypothetical protein
MDNERQSAPQTRMTDCEESRHSNTIPRTPKTAKTQPAPFVIRQGHLDQMREAPQPGQETTFR